MGHQVKVTDQQWERAAALAERIRASSPVPEAYPTGYGAGDVIRAVIDKGLVTLEATLAPAPLEATRAEAARPEPSTGRQLVGSAPIASEAPEPSALLGSGVAVLVPPPDHAAPTQAPLDAAPQPNPTPELPG